MSQADLIVLALYKLQSLVPGPVPLAQLIVEAWKLDKAKFGLAGWEEEYPDSNRTACVLSNKSGPVAKGLMRRPFPKMFELTEMGWKYGKMLKAKH